MDYLILFMKQLVCLIRYTEMVAIASKAPFLGFSLSLSLSS